MLCFDIVRGVVLLVLVIGFAYAHGDADWIRQGEFKSKAGSSCCGEQDCERFPKQNVVLKEDGFYELHYQWKQTDVTENFPIKETKNSVDDDYWRCHYSTDGKTKCFFAPRGTT